jgi:hypothetical protein
VRQELLRDPRVEEVLLVRVTPTSPATTAWTWKCGYASGGLETSLEVRIDGA